MDGLTEFEERSMQPPVKLTPQQEELCRRLDSLNQMTIQGQELSKMFKGAVFALREENWSNPDWLAQSAHSLRDILYQFKSNKTTIDWVDMFIKYGSVQTENKKFEEIVGRVYNRITKVAHHLLDLNIEEYEKLFYEYEKVLLWALDRQVDIHNQIDNFLSEVEPGKSGK